ncbi:MAG: P-loop NTPase [Candidatus Altiarchaeota archaeon]|nr:P-loop NTPase [Candidatus Altiarchaeota archaeon]
MRTLAVTAGKGGVGKTTLTVNLGLALKNLGFRVCIIDANFTAPDVALHLGFSPDTTIWDALKGKNHLSDALYEHECGLHIIPGSQDLEVAANRDIYKRLKRKMRKLKYDFIILDTPPGLGDDAKSALIPAKEIIVVATPEWPSLANAYRAALFASDMKKHVIGVVLNRATVHELEPNPVMIENVMRMEVLGKIPEDMSVRKSIAIQNPVVLSYPESAASIEIRKTAHLLGGIPWKDQRQWWQKLWMILGQV